MPIVAFEIDGMLHQRGRSMPKPTLPERGRIGSGVALATTANKAQWTDNPHHWQTLILLLPLFHNPDSKGYRKPISGVLIQRTIDEMRRMFSGYTLARVMGWYWDEAKNTGLPDELMRLEVDGVFSGNDLYVLHTWKERLRRRFRQNFIYMRLVASGTAI
ncbi:MAG TPA: hypothetical protein VMU48_10460 [Terracidiphilus sp.]|nr:hypothetical protein [Terracidiphilus sp.]